MELSLVLVPMQACSVSRCPISSCGWTAKKHQLTHILDYGANNEPFEQRQLMVLDAGCEWNNYASDVTRTFPLNGEWSPEAKDIYDLVDQMQQECIAMVKPGADYRVINNHAHKVAVRGLMKLGLLRNGTFQEIYEAGASVPFLPHGLGRKFTPIPRPHTSTNKISDYLGLEVHDVGENGALLSISDAQTPNFKITTFPNIPGVYNPSILEAGHVITVEPGLYFNRDAFERMYLKDPVLSKYIDGELLEKYYPVGGVRIEDDLWVKEGGFEILSLAPKGEDALRIIREGTDAGN